MTPSSRENPNSGVVQSTAHIVVVDDDVQIRQLAAKLLREHGYRVTTAGDGRGMWSVLDLA